VTRKGDVLLEFTITSFDAAGIHSFEAVRHYRVAGDQVSRVQPIALRPRFFVEEWVRAQWRQSMNWSSPAGIGQLQSWHGRLHEDDLSWRYLDDTAGCRKDLELWQVSVGLGDKEMPLYFIVRWHAPYRFEMVEIRTTRRSDCDLADDVADGNASLFPIQEWRQ